MSSLSIVIITYNEEKNIGRCLESIRWADEIVVVDAFSTDRTLEIVREYTDQIYQHENTDQLNFNKNYGFERATGDWLLSLDADEVVTPELAEEMRAAIQTDEFDGYALLRKDYVWNRWMHCWYPLWLTRLFRRGKGRFPLQGVHEGLEVNGPVGQLTHPLLHYSYADLTQYFVKFNYYTSCEAREMWEKHCHKPERLTSAWFVWNLLYQSAHQFLKLYIYHKGFLDGLPGLIICSVSTLYRFVCYAKLWELRNRENLTSCGS